MNGVALLLAGLYIIGLGWNANGTALIRFLGQQKSFVTWLIAVLILYGLTRIRKLKPFVYPFIVLAIIAIILKQQKQITDEISKLEGKK